jgi:hypothetical protein
MINGNWRISTIAMVATIAIAGFSNGALARPGVSHAHLSKLSQQRRAAPDESYPASVAVPPMRYYGGPKSPMWRG